LRIDESVTQERPPERAAEFSSCPRVLVMGTVLREVLKDESVHFSLD
jgi:hypothetical protein